MSCYTDWANRPDTFEEFQAKGDAEERREEARYLREMFESLDCECQCSGDMADASRCPLHGERRGMLAAAGLAVEEAAAFEAVLERKPVRVARIQLELFGEVA